MSLDMARCPEGEQNHRQLSTAALDPPGDLSRGVSAPPAFDFFLQIREPIASHLAMPSLAVLMLGTFPTAMLPCKMGLFT